MVVIKPHELVAVALPTLNSLILLTVTVAGQVIDGPELLNVNV